MSKISKIWKNRGKIYEGIMNSIFKKEDVEEVAEQRMLICMDCPDIDVDGSKCDVIGTNPCCGQCGCSLKFKVRSLSSGCGNEENPLWDPVMTEKEEDTLKESIGYADPE